MLFNTIQLERYAQVLLWGLQTARNREFTPGEIVLLRYDNQALPLAEILFANLVGQGLHPVLRSTLSPKMEIAFFEKATETQLAFIPPGEQELMQHLHGSISILAPDSLTHLQKVSPAKIGKTLLSRKLLRDILEEREGSGEFGWTLCLYPTMALAKHAGLQLEEYQNQIIKACYLDKENPVKHWQEIYHSAKKIKLFLNNLEIKSIQITGPNTDLTITPGEQRQWIGISGHNIPSFEIFTSPDWRGTQGHYFMDQPSFRNGNLVKDLYLEFTNGQVSKVRAKQGQKFVEEQIKVDKHAGKLGEFSLTDKRFSRINKFMAHTLFDENFGGQFGNCHIALGASYADTFLYGAGALSKEDKKNLGFNESALHWDLVNTQPKTVTALLSSGEKKTIYQDGLFLIDN